MVNRNQFGGFSLVVAKKNPQSITVTKGQTQTSNTLSNAATFSHLKFAKFASRRRSQNAQIQNDFFTAAGTKQSGGKNWRENSNARKKCRLFQTREKELSNSTPVQLKLKLKRRRRRRQAWCWADPTSRRRCTQMIVRDRRRRRRRSLPSGGDVFVYIFGGGWFRVADLRRSSSLCGECEDVLVSFLRLWWNCFSNSHAGGTVG